MCRYYLPVESSMVEGATSTSCNIGTTYVEAEVPIHFYMKYNLWRESWHYASAQDEVMWSSNVEGLTLNVQTVLVRYSQYGAVCSTQCQASYHSTTHVFGRHANKLTGQTLWLRTFELSSFPECKPRLVSRGLWVLECMELYRHYLLFRDHNKMKLSYRCEVRVRVCSFLVDDTLRLRDIFNFLVERKPGPGYYRRLVYRTSALSQQNGYHKTDGHDQLLCRHDCVSFSVQTFAPNILARHLRQLLGLDKKMFRTDKNRCRK